MVRLWRLRGCGWNDHVSDMSWTRKVNHPSEGLEKGDEVTTVVLEIDSTNHRISLGLKQAQEDYTT